MPKVIYRPEIDTLFIRLAGFPGLHVAEPLSADFYALRDVETQKIVGLQIENWKGQKMTTFEEWEAKQMRDPAFRAEVRHQESSLQRIRRRASRRLRWRRFLRRVLPWR